MAENAKELFDMICAKYQREQREKKEQQKEKEEQQLHNLWQFEIGQKVKKFKTPSAKRAVSDLLDDKNDWEKCYNEFKCLVGKTVLLFPLMRTKTRLSLF